MYLNLLFREYYRPNYMPPVYIMNEALALTSLLIPGQTGREQLRISALRVQISVTTNHSLVATSEGLGLSVSHSKIW